jgi:AcrR family transcriptional regulator
MPRKTEEQKEERRQEIIDACERIYQEQGFNGVTLKEISSQTSMTRPAVYTYFETKDEILLALLNREYEIWIESLAGIRSIKTQLTRNQLAEELAHSLDEREVLLRIQNMNLYEIEMNSRIERLAEFKGLYGQAVSSIKGILKYQIPGVEDIDCEKITQLFQAFLFGVYPFVFHTDKQLEAMKTAGVQPIETTIFEMVYDCLIRLLPDKK